MDTEIIVHLEWKGAKSPFSSNPFKILFQQSQEYAILSFAFKWNQLTPGWTSLMVAITFFSGVILISLWMIGEYISRIYDESKGRPQYIINKEINIEEK